MSATIERLFQSECPQCPNSQKTRSKSYFDKKKRVTATLVERVTRVSLAAIEKCNSMDGAAGVMAG
jgi:hypothetical protein